MITSRGWLVLYGTLKHSATHPGHLSQISWLVFGVTLRNIFPRKNKNSDQERKKIKFIFFVQLFKRYEKNFVRNLKMWRSLFFVSYNSEPPPNFCWALNIPFKAVRSFVPSFVAPPPPMKNKGTKKYFLREEKKILKVEIFLVMWWWRPFHKSRKSNGATIFVLALVSWRLKLCDVIF